MKNLNFSDQLKNQNTNSETTIEESPTNLDNIEKTNYDFTEAQNPSNSLQKYSDDKKAELNDKIFQPKKKENKSAIWVLSLLVFCLTGLCGFTTYQIYNYEKNTLNSNSLLNLKNITLVPGDKFNFLLGQSMPEGFKIEKQAVDFEWINDKKGFVNSIISTENISGAENINGISVYTTPYDNKLSQKEFAEVVTTKVGNSYKMEIPNLDITNSNLNQIIPTDTKLRLKYYTTVTNFNYYVIKVYTMGKESPQSNNKAEFAENILNNIRLD